MSDSSQWYVGFKGQQTGPFPTPQVVEQIRAGAITAEAYVYGGQSWIPIAQVPDFAQALAPAPVAPPPPVVAPPVGPAPMVADQIDFEVHGGDRQYVEIVLDPNEAAIGDASGVFYFEAGIEMERAGGLSTVAKNVSQARKKIAFSAPGKIVALDLRQYNGVLHHLRDAFVCAAKGIAIGTAGEFQKLEGQGLAFVAGRGAIVARELADKEVLTVAATTILVIEPRVGHEVNGDHAKLTGPGHVWLQSWSK